MQVCIMCNINKNDDEFYKNGNTLFLKCKACISTTNKRVVKKLTGFAKLSKEVQDKIKEDIASGVKLRRIALAQNIEYVSLWNWRKKGLIF